MTMVLMMMMIISSRSSIVIIIIAEHCTAAGIDIIIRLRCGYFGWSCIRQDLCRCCRLYHLRLFWAWWSVLPISLCYNALQCRDRVLFLGKSICYLFPSWDETIGDGWLLAVSVGLRKDEDLDFSHLFNVPWPCPISHPLWIGGRSVVQVMSKTRYNALERHWKHILLVR